jgi:hypothetical protein
MAFAVGMASKNSIDGHVTPSAGLSGSPVRAKDQFSRCKEDPDPNRMTNDERWRSSENVDAAVGAKSTGSDDVEALKTDSGS